MVIYEININVNNAVLGAYIPWLKKHIQLITNCSGFIDTTLCKEENVEGAAPDQSKLTIHYRVNDFDALQNYLDNHASAMRQEGLEKFKDQFSITRRFFKVEDSFQNQQ